MKSNQIPTDGLNLNIKCINLAAAKSIVERRTNENQVWWYCDSELQGTASSGDI